MLGIAQTFCGAGYRVVVGGGDATPTKQAVLAGCPGIEYSGLGELPRPGMSSMAKAARVLFTFGARSLRWLDRQPTRPAAVVLYGGYSPYLLRLLPWCARQRVLLIADLVEWYDGRHVQGGVLGPIHWNNELAMQRLVPRVQGVIAISSYLADYYRRRGCVIVRIPPTMDTQHLAARQLVEVTARLRLVYAGSPGKKDFLAEIIRGMQQADPAGTRVELVVVGPTPAQVCGLLGAAELPGNVQALGRVGHAQVMETVRGADFSVLLRPQLRFAHAGFPTKVAESLAVGTPVICNLTSDLGDYIHDGREGVICAGHTAETFAATLQRALALSPPQRQTMRAAARARAEAVFDFRCYIQPVQVFMQEVGA